MRMCWSSLLHRSLTETGHRCQVTACHRRAGPGTTLHPHHADPWATSHTTRLDDTVILCTVHHHDLHLGRRVLHLRNGRSLDHTGWREQTLNGP